MKPIEPPFLIQTGIALYVPFVLNASIIRLEIFYTEQNPVFSWVSCQTGLTKIWSKQQTQSSGGTLFLYQIPSQENLALGFYTLRVIALLKTSALKTGQLTLGIVQPTARLVVGLPYSIYPPIDLA